MTPASSRYGSIRHGSIRYGSMVARPFLFLFAFALAASGCGPGTGHAASEAEDTAIIRSELHDVRVVSVVDGLQHPWGMAFLPGGDMLVTERGSAGGDARPGRLRIIRNGELLPEPVAGLPEIRVGGQGGLMDVVLHPDFESNEWVYLSYSKPNDDDSEGTTAVIRGRLEGGALTDVEEVFEAQAWRETRGHHGSRLAFDEDGYLFVTVGDRQSSPSGDQAAHASQDLSNHMGTVSRLHDDGRVPVDNPFVGRDDALPEIWSYGHRNPQGIAFHPDTGELWVNEHGPQGGDEVNLIRPGRNYGWPVIGFGVNYGSGTPIHQSDRAEGMEMPVIVWTPSIAPSDLMIYSGDEFPEWRGQLFTTGLSMQQGNLSRATVEGATLVNEEWIFRGEYRLRSVKQGPDGRIYLATDHRGGGESPIIRLERVAEP